MTHRKTAKTGGAYIVDAAQLPASQRMLIACADRKVKVYDPKGKHLGDIPFPERPSNLCFGGEDGKTLFVTARKSLYSLAMKVGGAGFKDAGAPEGDKVEVTISSVKYSWK